MTHIAMNAPICDLLQEKDTAKNTGTATTNQTSRAPNKNRRAAESILIASFCSNIPVSYDLFFAWPISLGSENWLKKYTILTKPANHHRAC